WKEHTLYRLTGRIDVVDAAQLRVIEAVVVEYEEIVRRRRNIAEKRIVPLQREEVIARRSKDRQCDRNVVGGAEIMKATRRQVAIHVPKNKITGVFRAGSGIAYAVESRGIIAAVVIAGGGEIGDAVGLDLVD